MRSEIGRTTAVVVAIALAPMTVSAQSSRPTLHVNPKWEQCSFQLDRSLTQAAWHQFTEEAGLVVYFRPLSDARAMGRGHFEVSALQWGTAIDDADAAWNDTFVHPDATHWLFEGDRLMFPGLMIRAGVSDRTDVGVYLTKNFQANYGFFGGQVQQTLFARPRWDVAARLSFVSLYGPEDLDFALYGGDVVASRRMTLTSWAVLSPYVGVSTYLATAHEKTAAVDLERERVPAAQATAGASLELSKVRLGAEYSFARVSSLSFKLGIAR